MTAPRHAAHPRHDRIRLVVALAVIAAVVAFAVLLAVVAISSLIGVTPS